MEVGAVLLLVMLVGLCGIHDITHGKLGGKQ